MRIFAIPELDISVNENWEISDGPSVYLHPPSKVYDLTDQQVADLTPLLGAKKAFIAAQKAYIVAQANFKTSATGLMIENELAPEVIISEDYPKYRHDDLSELGEFDGLCLQARLQGIDDYIEVDETHIPLIKMSGVSDEDHARYLKACLHKKV